MIAGRITASHVGVGVTTPGSERRTCFRCGCTRKVNGRTKVTPTAFMCGDCKLVDPALARRLGLK